MEDLILGIGDPLGFEGRYSRGKMWFFLVALTGWLAIIAMVVVVGFDWKAAMAAYTAGTQPGATLDWHLVLKPLIQTIAGTASLAIVLLMLFIAAWAGLAAFVKRLHDRGKSAWWLIPYWLLPFSLGLASHLSDATLGAEASLVPTSLYLGLGVGALNMWVNAEMFWFRGTKGPNRFGPDPLAFDDGSPSVPRHHLIDRQDHRDIGAGVEQH